jgi:hypothetical protein
MELFLFEDQKMYMPVHFVWNIETIQAYISIQYNMREVPPFVKSYHIYYQFGESLHMPTEWPGGPRDVSTVDARFP